jgi:hypothetical protein
VRLRVKGSLGSRPAINMKGEFWQDARGLGGEVVSDKQPLLSIPILSESG